jgi:hypothetical protein
MDFNVNDNSSIRSDIQPYIQALMFFQDSFLTALLLFCGFLNDVIGLNETGRHGKGNKGSNYRRQTKTILLMLYFNNFTVLQVFQVIR